MKKIYTWCILVIMCPSIPIQSMDVVDDAITVTPSKKPNITLSSEQEVKQFVLLNRLHEKGVNLTNEELDAINIPEETMAKYMGLIAMGSDAPTPMHSAVVKSVRSLPKSDPDKLRQHKKVILSQEAQHGGDLTARSILEKKIASARSSQTTPKATATDPITETPKTKVKSTNGRDGSSLSLNLESILHPRERESDNSNFDPEELIQAKQHMRQLILEAAEATISSKDQEARRNAYVGIAATVISTAASIIGTYFTARETSDGCPSNSTGT